MLSQEEEQKEEECSLASYSSVGGDSEANLSVATPMLTEYTTTAATTTTTTTTPETQHADKKTSNDLENVNKAEPNETLGLNDNKDYGSNGESPQEHIVVHCPTPLAPLTTKESIDHTQEDSAALNVRGQPTDNPSSGSFSDTSIKSRSMHNDMSRSLHESHSGNNTLGNDADSTNRNSNNDNDDSNSNDSSVVGGDGDKNTDTIEKRADENDDGGNRDSWYQMILIGIAAGLYALFTLLKKCCKGGDEKEEPPEPPR